MTGKGVKREVGVWSWQETRPAPLCSSSRLGGVKRNPTNHKYTYSLKSQEYVLFIVGV